MKRAFAAAPIAALVFVAVLALVAVAMRGGLIGEDALRLWASASTAADGQVPIGRIVAAYPTLPFLATTLLAWLTPAGTPSAALVAAAVLALFAASCFLACRSAGFSQFGAGIASLLIAFHPALLHAALNGPADMFLALFLLALCLALYNLRARSGTSEVMGVGLALMAITFSHPIGAAFAFAAIPFLVFAVRPLLVANSAFNIVVALVFPTAFTLAAFTYVSWVFPGDGWSFLAASTQSLSLWSASESHLYGETLSRFLVADASLAMAVALTIGAPVAVVMLALVRGRRPLVIPALVFTAAVLGATVISVSSGFFGDPTALLLAAPVLAAAVVMRVPLVRERRILVTALLLVGWFGGLGGVALVDPTTVTALGAVVTHGGGERTDALTVGGAAAKRDGVLADVDNAPAFLLGRGSARGVFGPQSEPFALTLLFARIDTPFVAVPDPQSNVGASDRLNKAFPSLFREGLAGYRVVYQNNTWRLFGRIKDETRSKQLIIGSYNDNTGR